MQKKTHNVAGIVEQVRANDDNPAFNTMLAPKKHLARIYMMRTGVNGFTENEIPCYCRFTSGREYTSAVERSSNFRPERIDEKNHDGIGSHFRYRFTCRADVKRVIQLVNSNTLAAGYRELSAQEINDILTLYPDAVTAA